MKKFECRKVGMDCDYTATAETEEELMENAKAHGKEVHGLTDEAMTPEMMEKVKDAISDE